MQEYAEKVTLSLLHTLHDDDKAYTSLLKKYGHYANKSLQLRKNLEVSINCHNSHMVRHPCCVFINYNWVNQLSNTIILWLDICCLLHRYQLHVSALMAIFRLID
jgi:hypothetical protein